MMISVAEDMLQSCHQKKNKVYSETRFVASFFFRRSWEMFESFLILVKENRIIDSAVLLRSLCDMGINLGYIFAKDIDDREQEIRASKYLLEGNWQQLKLTENNLEGFREFNKDIEARRDELVGQIEDIKNMFKERFGVNEWKRLPTILQRAELSKFDILKQVYNQSYLDLSSIEHHNIWFGQHYVDTKECEPKKETNLLENYSQLRSAVSLFLFRIIFIEILNVFNQVFKLNWEEKILDMRKSQDEEYPLLKDS